ncbi:MAG: S24 family peptidase [Thiobacillaceae bacterium]
MEFPKKTVNIPIVVKPTGDAPPSSESFCSGSDPVALMVLGDSMEPEFVEGEIIVIELDGHVTDGSYVIAWHNEEYIFRQIIRRDIGWALHALNPKYPDAPIASLDAVKGVITLKKKPGTRKSVKYYVPSKAHA